MRLTFRNSSIYLVLSFEINNLKAVGARYLCISLHGMNSICEFCLWSTTSSQFQYGSTCLDYNFVFGLEIDIFTIAE